MSIFKLAVIPIANFKFWLAFAILLSMSSCSKVPEQAPENTKTADSVESTEFTGSWNAKGSRQSISLGKNRRGSIIELKGTMLLAGEARPGVGFYAELIALADSETGLVGRSVWTDEHGDQIFSEVKGEGDATSNHINGTFIGGTGRFAGLTGDYEFSWQFVLEAEDGSIQGRTIGLKGQVQLDQSTVEGDVQ